MAEAEDGHEFESLFLKWKKLKDNKPISSYILQKYRVFKIYHNSTNNEDKSNRIR